MSRWKEIRKVLVPVDFSPSSKEVLATAVDLAAERGAELVVLHVVTSVASGFDPAYGISADPRIQTDLEVAGRKQLDAVVAGVKGVKATGRLRTGAPGHEICLEAKEGGAGLVVIGTHGRTGLRHVFLGSVAESVVRHCACPVLTVRHPSLGAGQT
jgi:nucleotide-binding universal stress UspA family protein